MTLSLDFISFSDFQSELNKRELDTRAAHTPRMTERKASHAMSDKKMRDQFRENEKLVFQAELELLIGEYKRHELVFAVNTDYRTGVEARYVGEFLEQNEALIIVELQKRLHLPEGVIKKYLDNMSNVMRAKFALEELVNPFTGESIGFSAVELQPKKKRGERGQGKKSKQAKKGKRRPVLGYPSIAEANRKTKLGYSFIRDASRKMDKEFI